MQAGHSPPLRAELNAAVSTLANLRTISDWTRSAPDFLELVPYLPASVETINTCWPERNRLFTLAKALAPGRLQRLTNIRLMHIPRDAVVGNADGTQIVAACKNRNIELSFGFEKDYLREEVRFRVGDRGAPAADFLPPAASLVLYRCTQNLLLAPPCKYEGNYLCSAPSPADRKSVV